MNDSVNNNNKTYEIWRVLDHKDLGYYDIMYHKIDSIPNHPFKEDNHSNYIDAANEADRYIDYIDKDKSSVIARYSDKLYIIKNSDDIRRYRGKPYFNMRNLLKIKKENKVSNNNKKRKCNINYVYLFDLVIFIISLISYWYN